MEDLSGRVIKGYELKKLAGEGGFGAVYLANQRLIGREVAVKIILPQYANQPDFIRRFETEAQLVARLEHPHIVPLYDYWREPSGAYLVMRWLRGGSLNDSLRKEGAWSAERASVMLNQIAAALAVAHRQGVIHRDLKPENILLDENGNAYLTDFGIAKDLGGQDSITQNNALVGSPAYISPEQVRGHPVTPQSDIYMLGLLVYELLSGEHPFNESTAASLLYKHLSEPLPHIHDRRPELPIAINMVVQKATAKEAADRYTDVLEMASDFRRAIRPAADSRDTMYITSTSFNLPDPENPYKGLRAFQQADALDFFGREGLVNRLMDRLQENHPYSRFLAVIGPSGSGKSSVVKAGLIPALQRGKIPGSEHWFMVEMVPGIDPMEELEAALLRVAVNPPDSLLRQLNEDDRGFVRAVKRVLPGDSDGAELLLVIDQFEELFTLVDDEGMRAHFMNSLITAVTDPRSRIRVVITLRADFYDKPLNYVKFGELMQKRTEVVLPLSADEIERAVNGPAERSGLVLERGLTTSIVTDVNEQPGALPLLQYALTELFERREGRTLTLQAYHEMGGTLGALAQRADELYDGLGDEGQEAARQMFLRLVTLGEGAEDTRRRVLQEELMSIGDPDAMSLALDSFGRYRLITFDRDPTNRASTVEVAHEALIKQWGRLRGWLAESREDLRLQRRLATAADEWRAANRDASFLVRAGRLQQFEEWAANTTLTLNELERNFLKTSIDEREARAAEEKRRQEREAALERRSRRRLQMLVGVLAAATVIAAVLTAFAFSQRTEAERSAAEASALALAANARTALTENDTQLALSLAAQAVKAYSPAPVEVMRMLASAAYAPNFVYEMRGHTGSVTGVGFAPQQGLAASVSARGELFLWDLESGEIARQLDTDAEYYTGMRFSPDGTLLAVAEARALDAITTDDGQSIAQNAGALRLIDAETGEVVRVFGDDGDGHSDIITSLSFSADGRALLAGSLDRSMTLWDVQSGMLVQRFAPDDSDENFTGAVAAAALSPDGRYAVSGHVDETIANTGSDRGDRTVRVWDAATGEMLHRLDPKLGFVRAVDFSPDGQQVLAASWSGAAGGVIVIWDTVSGQEIQRIFADVSVIAAARFSPDGQSVLVGSWGRALSVWDIETGALIERFEGLQDRALAVDFSADGQYALVGTGNVGNNDIGVAFDAPASPRVWLIDLKDRAEMRTLRGHRDWVWEIDISADGTQAVSGGGPFSGETKDSRLLIWDIESGEIAAALGEDTDDGHTNTIDGVAFTPDGQQVLSGGWDSQVLLWQIQSGAIVQRFEGHEGRVYAVDVSPSGQYGASVDDQGAILLWDIASGEQVRRFESTDGHDAGMAINHVVFSPDSTHLLTSGNDQKIVMWNVADGSVAQTFIGHEDRVNTVEFSPDGTRIASTAWDATVRLWDVASGAQLREYIGHNSETFGVAFSADGASLVTGSSDATVRLWDVETAEELQRFAGHTSWIQSVKFHPDGEFAISGAQDNTLKVWRTAREPEAIMAFITGSRYLRDLTCAEHARYRIAPPEICASADDTVNTPS